MNSSNITYYLTLCCCVVSGYFGMANESINDWAMLLLCAIIAFFAILHQSMLINESHRKSLSKKPDPSVN